MDENVAEPRHLRRVRVQTRSDDDGNVHEVQIPKVCPDPGPLHELGGSQEQHSEAAMLLPHTKIYLAKLCRLQGKTKI